MAAKHTVGLWVLLASNTAWAVGPHRSWSVLPTGNGYGFASYDGQSRKVTSFWEHPYTSRAPGENTRDLAYDAYWGVRASGQGAWLSEQPLESMDYLEQSHVIHTVQHVGPLRAETWTYAPFGLESPAVMLQVAVTNEGRGPVADAAVYALLNFHLGSGAPEPGTDGERVVWDAASGQMTETGNGGLTLRYVPATAPSRHTVTPYNPYGIVKLGGDLPTVDDSGVVGDAVPGLQWDFANLAPGETRRAGVLVTTATRSAADAWLAGRTPELALQDEVTAWNAWRMPPPAGLSATETRIWRQSESVLRMGQVRESGAGHGQLLAALPPGIWSISWVRDMSYALAALARTGHSAEANAGVDFLLHAPVGSYRAQVGTDYYVSVVRYYGNGAEWSDEDANGPNIEFDGFGLSTWAARLAGRTELDRNSDSLRALIDPQTGLVKPDSSIWEVHWNGHEKRFAYTTITAAQGLCSSGDSATAAALRDALVSRLRLPTGGLAANWEELQRGEPARDAAVIEAINWGLIDPQGTLAAATLQEFERLRTPVNRGYFRNDDGGGYDSQEWVFIDLRVASALRRMGRQTEAEELLAWVTAQAEANYGLHGELYQRETADLAGAVPMVGFGAGAYLLALLDRTSPEAPNLSCFPRGASQMAPGLEPGTETGTGTGTGTERSVPTAQCSVIGLGSARAGASWGWGSVVLGSVVLGLEARRRRRRKAVVDGPLALGLGLGLGLGVGGCPMPQGGDGGVDVLQGGDTGQRDGGGGGDGGDVVGRDAPASVQGLPVRECVSSFRYALGHQANAVAVAGEWNTFSTTDMPMTDGLFTGTYHAARELPAGSYGYKFVADGTWVLDPSHGLTRYINGTENSRLDVGDCRKPLWNVLSYRVDAQARGLTVEFQYLSGRGRASMDPSSVQLSMNQTALPSSAWTWDASTARLRVDVTVPRDGKYTFRLQSKDTAGTDSELRYVPMWLEAEPFHWGDGVLYFVFTDRFRNGDPSNDGMVAGVDPRANYQGGDLKGVLAALQEGYFDALGVKALWLSPVNANTNRSGLGTGGYLYTGYHGYWVTEPRTVEEHFGTMAELQAVTAEAHRRGIRVLLDLVNNQLHEEHPYVREHRDWFNGDGTCVCGGANCDWDTHALDCWFTSYLPDVNWTRMAAVDTMIEDAMFWVTEADVDGFRVDAVKHMQHIASTTLRARLRERFETGNTEYYLVGETFTGADGRDLVRSYVSERELHAQFDFPLFWAIVGAFAQNQGTMGDLDNAVRASESAYGGAVMSPFLGNHDVERFLSRAAGDLSSNTQAQAWDNPPVAPDRDDPYNKSFLAFVFLLTQPGMPLVYYGDEVGLPGAADPDNRRMMPWGTEVSPRSQALLARIRPVAQARGSHPGLRRGGRVTLHTDGDGYVFARGAGPNLCVVALNRGSTSRTVSVSVGPELASQGTVLRDLLGGPSVTVNNGRIDVPFTPQGAALWVR